MREPFDLFNESDSEFSRPKSQPTSVPSDQFPDDLPRQLPPVVNCRAAVTSSFMRFMLVESVFAPCTGCQSPLWIIFATRRADTTVVTAITTRVIVVVSWKQTQAIAIKKNSNLGDDAESAC